MENAVMSRPEVDLSRVRMYTERCEVVGLCEVALPGIGWATKLNGKPWDTYGTAEEQVRAAIDAGATSFQFIIKDFDRSLAITYRYPDFGLREITTQPDENAS